MSGFGPGGGWPGGGDSGGFNPFAQHGGPFNEPSVPAVVPAAVPTAGPTVTVKSIVTPSTVTVVAENASGTGSTSGQAGGSASVFLTPGSGPSITSSTSGNYNSISVTSTLINSTHNGSSVQLPTHSDTSLPAPTTTSSPSSGSSKTTAIVATVAVIIPVLILVFLLLILRRRSNTGRGEHRNRWWFGRFGTNQNANNDTALIMGQDNERSTPTATTLATRRSSIATSFELGLTPRLTIGNMSEIPRDPSSLVIHESPTLPAAVFH